jgi:hypothetical protein
MRALLACDVRAAEAASSAFGFGALDRVEAGGDVEFVWFPCACPQAAAPARTTRSVMRRDGRTSLVVAVKWAEVYTWAGTQAGKGRLAAFASVICRSVTLLPHPATNP